MLGVERIVVAVHQDDAAVYVIEKAVQIARAASAKLYAVQVIFDPNVDSSRHDPESRQQLKTLMMQAGEEWLDETISSPGRDMAIESVTLWNKHEHEAILEIAEDFDADLIIKAARQPQGLDAVIHTPQDWHLLRHATVPVMMVKPAAWIDEPVILAAVDALHEDQAALNGRILTEARNLANILGGELDVVVAHPFVQPMIGPSAVPIDFNRVRQEAEKEISEIVKTLAREHDVQYRYLHIEEGGTADAIGYRADVADAEILVMGTVAREGVRGLLLGNTSETILYRINCDVAVLR